MKVNEIFTWSGRFGGYDDRGHGSYGRHYYGGYHGRDHGYGHRYGSYGHRGGELIRLDIL
jgi:hypothetical protein